MTHSTKRDWEFFRKAAKEMLWPNIDSEYQQELEGIVEGLRARTGSKLDVYDIVAFNAFEELPDYYVPWLDKQQKTPNAPNLKSPGNCSAFVATGSWTKDGQIVMAHNNWTKLQERGTLANRVRHRAEERLQNADGWFSGSDRERTTIRNQQRRADGERKRRLRIRRMGPKRQGGICAGAEGAAICGFDRRIHKDHAGRKQRRYANDWLLGDRKTGEIAQLELGLKSAQAVED